MDKFGAFIVVAVIAFIALHFFGQPNAPHWHTVVVFILGYTASALAGAIRGHA